MKRMLWIGDAACSTGFAKYTHRVVPAMLPDWDVHVLAINYIGDPHNLPYKLYPCWPGRDAFGLGRTEELVKNLDPDVVFVLNDPWNVPGYVEEIRKASARTKIVVSTPVDGKNCRGNLLNGADFVIFWTNFAVEEAIRGGFEDVPYAVVPLGVDLDIYKPFDRRESREKLALPTSVVDGFIVGNVNRNQPRKRLDLTIQYFCEWAKAYDARDAYLFLHIAPTGDKGYDAVHLMKYYGMRGRLLLSVPEIGFGVVEEALPDVYSAFDVQLTTTQGEGWGLCTLEGMACGVPQIVPDWAALGEWAIAAIRIPCTSTCVTPSEINAIGGVPDKEVCVHQLNQLYKEAELRRTLANEGLELAREDRFRWESIAARTREIVEGVVSEEVTEAIA